MPASVKTVTPHSEKPWIGELVKRRYTVVITDESGIDRTHEIGPHKVAPTDTGAAYVDAFFAAIKQDEIRQYKKSVRSGINPFSAPSRWNNRAELLHAILSDALSLPASDPLVYNGMPYLANVTDAELIALFGHDQTWVDNVRAQAANLLASKTSLDDYVPVGV